MAEDNNTPKTPRTRNNKKADDAASIAKKSQEQAAKNRENPKASDANDANKAGMLPGGSDHGAYADQAFEQQKARFEKANEQEKRGENRVV